MGLGFPMKDGDDLILLNADLIDRLGFRVFSQSFLKCYFLRISFFKKYDFFFKKK